MDIDDMPGGPRPLAEAVARVVAKLAEMVRRGAPEPDGGRG